MLTIFGCADSGNGIANGRQVGGIEIVFHQHRFFPINKGSQRQVVTEVGSEPFHNRFTGHISVRPFDDLDLPDTCDRPQRIYQSRSAHGGLRFVQSAILLS